jgi:general secretion pathway protein D
MKYYQNLIRCFFLVFFFHGFCFSQTIEEKTTHLKSSIHGLNPILEEQLSITNTQIKKERAHIKKLFQEVREAQDEAELALILKKMREHRKNLNDIQENWRKQASFEFQDSYGLWFFSDGTIEQLISEFAALDYVYLIPPEIAYLPVNIASHLPIPREAWDEIIEMILFQNGIGVRETSPLVRELFIMNKGIEGVSYVCNDVRTLDTLSDSDKVLFLLDTGKLDAQAALYFIEKLNVEEQFQVFIFQQSLVLVGRNHLLKEILKVFEFVKYQYKDRIYKILTLNKASSGAIKEILDVLWEKEVDHGDVGDFDLKIITIEKNSKALFLLGKEEHIRRTEEIVADIEKQMSDGNEPIIHWYSVKYSDAKEIARTLSQVYRMLKKEKISAVSETVIEESRKKDTGSLLIDPPSVDYTQKATENITQGIDGEHFVVDEKTGSIIMVVEQNMLSKLKQVLKRLDVPKKMVRIDVLLFEKHIADETRFGLNFLKMGTDSSDTDHTKLRYRSVDPRPNRAIENELTTIDNDGLLNFIWGRKSRGSMPSFDLAYNFLLAQDNIQINANPSVVTINQTPAVINLMDEISLNTGSDIIPTDGRPVVQQKFERKQYGIQIQITPIIHLAFNEDKDELEEASITLKTTLLFDTEKSDKNNRPTIFRRQIRNEVRVLDGETVILGGLQRKDQVDNKESLPFIGEVPGLGKLFSETRLVDESVQMFIFITPKILGDNREEDKAIRLNALKKRPGDLPEFLEHLQEAKNKTKQKEFEFGLVKILRS